MAAFVAANCFRLKAVVWATPTGRVLGTSCASP